MLVPACRFQFQSADTLKNPAARAPAPHSGARPRPKKHFAMGHSQRAKFKREVRVQRREQETPKEQERKSAVQLALERAAAAPKVEQKNSRVEDPSDEKRHNRRQGPEISFDKETLAFVEEARAHHLASAKWGITAPAMLQKKKGVVIKKLASTGARLAASFQNDSKQRKGQKQIIKAVMARGIPVKGGVVKKATKARATRK